MPFYDEEYRETKINMVEKYDKFIHLYESIGKIVTSAAEKGTVEIRIEDILKQAEIIISFKKASEEEMKYGNYLDAYKTLGTMIQNYRENLPWITRIT